MTGERDFACGSEDADAASVLRVGRREDESGFREVELARDAGHRGFRNSASVREDGELISAELIAREDVGRDELEGGH